MWVGLFTPSVSFAATVEEQRIVLIEQLISVLQQKVAVLIAQLEAQQKQITTINQPVFGSIDNMPTQTVPAPFAVTISTEFGKGSWAEYQKRCGGTGAETGEGCENRFLDGMVRFAVNGAYKHATIKYHPTGKTPTQAENAWMDLAPDGEHGYFQPNTEYTYTIEATNEAGQVAHVEGTFKTGKY